MLRVSRCAAKALDVEEHTLPANVVIAPPDTLLKKTSPLKISNTLKTTWWRRMLRTIAERGILKTREEKNGAMFFYNALLVNSNFSEASFNLFSVLVWCTERRQCAV